MTRSTRKCRDDIITSGGAVPIAITIVLSLEMLRFNALRPSVQRLVAQQRAKSTSFTPRSLGGAVPANVLQGWYSTFGKSGALYASWVIMLIVVGEYATGKMTDAAWTLNNYGKTFNTVDWSKFDEIDEDDEDDDDDE